MLLLGLVAILAPAAVADHGHGAGHGQKPKFLSCKPLVDFESEVQKVGLDTGITPEMGQSEFSRLPVGQGSSFRHVPETYCALHWANDQGNSVVYGGSGFGQGAWVACAASGLTEQDFKKTIPIAEHADLGGLCASILAPGYTVEKFTPIGKGSEGYVVAAPYGNPQGDYPIDYSVYAWTKGGGCFVGFDAWPLSLAETEAYVNRAVGLLPRKC